MFLQKLHIYLFCLWLAFCANIGLSQLNAEEIHFKDYIFSVINPEDENSQIALINEIVGATSLYELGVFGSRASIANIEACLPWLDHQAFESSTIGEMYVPEGALNSTAQHATAVSSTMAALGPELEGGQYAYLSFGIAPLARLNAAAIATQLGENGEFSTSTEVFYNAYKHFILDNQVDVVNSSWGGTGEEGLDVFSSIADALLASAPTVTMVVSVGNAGPEANTVGSPAKAFNVISVGALANPNSFDEIAEFSSRGASDFYNPVTKTTIKNAMVGVDIVAPGTNIISAGYDESVEISERISDNYYYYNGTSFSAPIVAGAVALLVDTSKILEADANAVERGWSAKARDSRVIKAVLLNSAKKPQGWSNNSQLVNGTLVTTQALDYAYGAGILDVNKAFSQYTNFTNESAWLTNSIFSGMEISYNIGEIDAGSTLTSTLVWFAHNSADFTEEYSDTLISDYALANLDLELCISKDGELVAIAASIAEYSSVEHIYLTLTQSGQYYLKVIFGSMVYGDTLSSEEFALAWSVIPEPATYAFAFALLAIALAFFKSSKKKNF